jgi:hypothetical protein
MPTLRHSQLFKFVCHDLLSRLPGYSRIAGRYHPAPIEYSVRPVNSCIMIFNILILRVSVVEKFVKRQLRRAGHCEVCCPRLYSFGRSWNLVLKCHLVKLTVSHCETPSISAIPAVFIETTVIHSESYTLQTTLYIQVSPEHTHASYSILLRGSHTYSKWSIYRPWCTGRPSTSRGPLQLWVDVRWSRSPAQRSIGKQVNYHNHAFCEREPEPQMRVKVGVLDLSLGHRAYPSYRVMTLWGEKLSQCYMTAYMDPTCYISNTREYICMPPHKLSTAANRHRACNLTT